MLGSLNICSIRGGAAESTGLHAAPSCVPEGNRTYDLWKESDDEVAFEARSRPRSDGDGGRAERGGGHGSCVCAGTPHYDAEGPRLWLLLQRQKQEARQRRKGDRIQPLRGDAEAGRHPGASPQAGLQERKQEARKRRQG